MEGWPNTLNSKKRPSLRSMFRPCCTLEGCPVALVAGGVGKVNAAIAVQQLISLCGAKAVIDAGAAGGLRDSLAPFDTVVAEQVAYHDVAEEILTESHPHLPTIWMRPDPRLLEAARRGLASQPFPGRKVVFGRCITGEAFIAGRSAWPCSGPLIRILWIWRPLPWPMGAW